MMRSVLILAVGVLVSGGCQQAPPSATTPMVERPQPVVVPVEPKRAEASSVPAADDLKPVPRELLKRISYKRTGGFVREQSTLSVTPAGNYYAEASSSNSDGTHIFLGSLNDDTRRELLGTTANWDQLADEYLPANSGPGDYRMEIRVGDKTVVVSDATENVPPKVVRACKILDGLTR